MGSEQSKGLPECREVLPECRESLVWLYSQVLGTLYIDLDDFGACAWEPHQHLEFMNALSVLRNRSQETLPELLS